MRRLVDPRWSLVALLLVAAVGCGSPEPPSSPPSTPAATPTAPAETPTPAASVAVQTPADLRPAERAFIEARLDETVQLLNEGSQEATDRLMLAFALQMQGHNERAERIFRHTMRRPGGKDDHLFRGFVAALTGNAAEAVRRLELERARPQNRFFAEALYVEFLAGSERFEEAEVEATKLEQSYPDSPVVHHIRGHLETGRQAWQAALEAYRRSEELGRRNPDVDDGIAHALIELGQFAEAHAVVERCRSEFPEHTEILFYATRLESLDPAGTPEALERLAAEYEKRSARADRLEEVATWRAGTPTTP
jgi:tetratricopeptide (TPR) repeat protein